MRAAASTGPESITEWRFPLRSDNREITFSDQDAHHIGNRKAGANAPAFLSVSSRLEVVVQRELNLTSLGANVSDLPEV